MARSEKARVEGPSEPTRKNKTKGTAFSLSQRQGAEARRPRPSHTRAPRTRAGRNPHATRTTERAPGEGQGIPPVLLVANASSPLKTSLNSPGGALRIKSEAIFTCGSSARRADGTEVRRAGAAVRSVGRTALRRERSEREREREKKKKEKLQWLKIDGAPLPPSASPFPPQRRSPPRAHWTAPQYAACCLQPNDGQQHGREKPSFRCCALPSPVRLPFLCGGRKSRRRRCCCAGRALAAPASPSAGRPLPGCVFAFSSLFPSLFLSLSLSLLACAAPSPRRESPPRSLPWLLVRVRVSCVCGRAGKGRGAARVEQEAE